MTGSGERRGLFVNAPSLPEVPAYLLCQTPWRGTWLSLRAAEREAVAEFPAERFSFALCNLPKSLPETKRLLARAGSLAETVLAAAPNDSGGKRIPGLLREAGVAFDKTGKAKCVLCRVEQPGALANLDTGPDYFRGGHGFFTAPGIFGWDRIDEGSRLLVEHFPASFSGIGADFGCGYGYLTRAVLKRGSGLERLHAADADARAVEAVRRNTAGRPEVSAHWLDLTEEELPEKVDFVVMNPPFHQARALDFEVGPALIAKAAATLRPGGVLWMVANRHLPYEEPLRREFNAHDKLVETDGFKIFRAVK